MPKQKKAQRKHAESSKLNWSLPQLLDSLHREVQQQLELARKSFAHPGTKGDASETVWLELFQKYLPQRYQSAKAHVVDSSGRFSEQIDVLIFDRQYSPFIFNYRGQQIIPAESVYAAFEAKQTISANLVKYAKQKVASVRALKRTSLPIPHAGGVFPPKPLPHIIGGILSFESNWHPALGASLENALRTVNADERLDIGCIAAHGIFSCDSNGCHTVEKQVKAATAFLFELIARLQASATVPMIDVRAYANWLTF